MKSVINLWANFLANEKLRSADISEEWTMRLISLCEALAAKRSPRIASHKDKLLSRQFVCETAMDLGLDLPAIRNRRGKVAMGRGLLDAWNKTYAARHGTTHGTASDLEAKRRDIVTKLSKKD